MTALLLSLALVAPAQTPPDGVLPVGADGKPLNLDFETGSLKDWTAEGDAFRDQPVKGDTVAPRRPGDVDLNGVVDLDDLFMLLNAWGEVVPGGPPADFNNNGVIDTDDLFTLINHWGS